MNIARIEEECVRAEGEIDRVAAAAFTPGQRCTWLLAEHCGCESEVEVMSTTPKRVRIQARSLRTGKLIPKTVSPWSLRVG